MTTESKTNMAHKMAAGLDPRLLGYLLGAVRFIWHYTEMMLAMMAGAYLFELVVSKLPAPAASASGLQPGTILYSSGVALSMMVVMVGWMIVRRHGLRHSAEMAIAMLAPVAFVGLVSLLKGDASLAWFTSNYCTAMCVGMLAAMIFRWEHYTGKAGHSAHVGH